MMDECPSCGGRKLKSETSCEDCLLARLAWLRKNPHTEPLKLVRKCHSMGRPIRIKRMDKDSTVYEVDRVVLDELRALDIFYMERNFNAE